jgi:hypothetical protein
MEELPLIKHELSSREKFMIVRCHHYFLKEKSEKRAGAQRKVRQRVAECLGISVSTVARIIAQWNRQFGENPYNFNDKNILLESENEDSIIDSDESLE